MIRTRLASAAALGLAALTPTPALSAQDAARTAAPATGAVAVDTSALAVTFTDLATPSGQIMLVLFDSKDSFDGKGAPTRMVMVPVTGDTASTTIPDLAHGRYGFKIFHDINGDGKLNTNPFGMPIEPFAFSNNAVGNMGPASWDAAAFDIAGPTTQTIAFR